MESGTNNYPMKVVWLCHFSNKKIKDFFNTPQVKEFAPWINGLIELFEDRTDIEIHIVAPNIFTNRYQYIKIRNIQYHFYPYIPYIIPRRLYNHYLIDARTNFYFAKKVITKIINDISPSLIHLHGGENPYYSAGILDLFGLYPILLTVQGFVRKASARDYYTIKRIKIEEQILKRAKHFGVRTNDMSKVILELNPKAHLYFHNYPLTIPPLKKDNDTISTYDIIFFAKVTKDKGIEDLLEAIAFVKKEKSDVSLHVIGSTNKNYLQHLKNVVKQLNIESNVKFLGFMDTQLDIYKHAIHARICVLPTYHDIVPGTIVESMFMKLPVITYAVTGMPEINEKGEVIVLVEKNNIQQLSNEITALLKSESKRKSLAEYAYAYVCERFQHIKIVNDIMKAYDEILS